MSEQRALFSAPLAIFPVALVFFVAQSLLNSDMRELIVSPFSALFITVGGYPIAVAVCWMMLRYAPKLVFANLGIALLLGLISAEASFWIFIHPFWQRDLSNISCAALVAGCGLATALAFHRLSQKHPPL